MRNLQSETHHTHTLAFPYIIHIHHSPSTHLPQSIPLLSSLFSLLSTRFSHILFSSSPSLLFSTNALLKTCYISIQSNSPFSAFPPFIFSFLHNNMNQRPRIRTDMAVFDVFRRQLGQLSARNFALRLATSEDIVLRLDISRKLEKHKGCVNTVSFNADGDILVSGSDDSRVILWDWETGNVKLSFDSGHTHNIFQANIMPFSDDRSIVTCAADGQVRHAQILERGEVKTKLLTKHQGRAHKLAIEPGSPHTFYTCGEDGVVQHFDLRSGTATELFTCQSTKDRRYYAPVVHLNAIAIDPRNPNLFAVGGSDEYARIYDLRKYKWDESTDFGQPTDLFCPRHLIGDEQVGITGLAFSEQSELLVSYNDELIYLFSRDMGLGPNLLPASAASPSNTEVDEKMNAQVYKGHKNRKTVKGINFLGPNCEYVMSGSDCGRIFMWRKKGGQLVRVMEADKQVVNCVESHPHTMVLASSGIDSDIKIWTPNALEKATLPENIEQKTQYGDPWMASPLDVRLSSLPRHRNGFGLGRNDHNSTIHRAFFEFMSRFNDGSQGSYNNFGDGLTSQDLFTFLT